MPSSLSWKARWRCRAGGALALQMALPSPKGWESLTLMLKPCNVILQLGCFPWGRSWIILTVNRGPGAGIFHLFLRNSVRCLGAHPCWAELASPDEKQDSSRLLCVDETIHEMATGAPNSGVAALHSQTYSFGVPRLAEEDRCKNNHGNSDRNSKGKFSFLVSSSLSSPFTTSDSSLQHAAFHKLS